MIAHAASPLRPLDAGEIGLVAAAGGQPPSALTPPPPPPPVETAGHIVGSN